MGTGPIDPALGRYVDIDYNPLPPKELRDARTALSYTPVSADGTPNGTPRRLAARTTRPAPTTLEATFLPAAAGLTVGPYAWRAETAWTDAADLNCVKTCTDRFPDDGEVAGDIALLAVPPCFGAAARDPSKPCENPDLRDTVTPLPAQAKAVADPYCDKREHSGLITACGFGAAPADAARTFAVVGDSHAANFKTALAVVTLAKRWRGVSIVRNSCPATKGIPILPTPTGSRRCRDWNSQVRTWLAKHREIDTVFLTAPRLMRLPKRKIATKIKATDGGAEITLRSAAFHHQVQLGLGSLPVTIDETKDTLTWKGVTYSIKVIDDCGRYGWHAEKDGVGFDFCTATQGVAGFDLNGVSYDCDMKR